MNEHFVKLTLDVLTLLKAGWPFMTAITVLYFVGRRSDTGVAAAHELRRIRKELAMVRRIIGCIRTVTG